MTLYELRSRDRVLWNNFAWFALGALFMLVCIAVGVQSWKVWA